MAHDFEPVTKVCLRCFITKAEALTFDPPAACGDLRTAPVPAIALVRKHKLQQAGLLREPEPEPIVVGED